MYRLLRALAGIGVFVELDGQCFANSNLSQLLRTDVSGSVSAMAAMTCGLMRGALGELVHSVRTGQPGFETSFSFLLIGTALTIAGALWIPQTAAEFERKVLRADAVTA